MGITPRYNQADVHKYLLQGKMQIERSIIQILKYAGEKFVKDARESLKIEGDWKQRVLTKSEMKKGVKKPAKGAYIDQTGNLRSSIGYFVLNNGQIVFDNFTGTSEGVAAGKEALGLVKNKSGYQLIGVAGMEYASYVESKGYNVISSQSVIILSGLEKSLKKYVDKMNAKGIKVGFDIDDIGYEFISSELRD